jgi:uncharacterized protein
MQRVFVDTSAWYALIDRNDPEHTSVVTQLNVYRGRLVTSNYIFDETLTLLRYRLGFEPSRKFGEQVRNGQLVQLQRISPRDEALAWDIFIRYQDQAFSYTDCTSFTFMQRLSLSQAIALDNDFRLFGFQTLP